MKSILSLGDSYTIGTGVSQEESLPYQLAAALRVRGMQVAEPLVIARNGWTTDELQEGMAAAGETIAQSLPFDLVTLLIGVNNQYRGYPLEGYREEFAALLAQAITFAGGDPGRVIVLSIPDWSITPFAEGRNPERISAEVEAFNAVNLEEAQKAGVRYVNITQASCLAIHDLALLAPDKLHPSGKMVARWVELMLPVAEQILK